MDDFSSRPNPLDEAFSATTSSLEAIREHLRELQDGILESLPVAQLSEAQIQDALENLPRLTEQDLADVGHNDSCPICLNPYLAILAEEEMAIAMDSPAHPIEYLGVTKLSQTWQCGHVFCRKDISKWIEEGHDSCPLCRHLLVKPRPRVEGEPPEAVPQPDPLVDLERQITAHIDLLRSHADRDARASLESNMSLIVGRMAQEDSTAAAARRNDRNDFSGMYS